ncbi:MAG: carboxypeptidase-like regulatory domain-containing protein [Pyrinomonadaceae bacterium]
MARRLKKIESISVASPCASDWDDMAGDDQVRFCGRCDKTVFNLSAMTRREAEETIARTQGHLCARFVRLPGGMILTTGEAAYSPRTGTGGRASQLLGASFAAILGLGASAFAQSSTQICEPSSQSSQYQIKRADRRGETGESKRAATLHGTIYDTQSAAIARAKVTLTNEKTKQDFVAETDEDGAFVFRGPESGTYTFAAFSLGFVTFNKPGLKLNAGEDVRFDATLQVGALMGEVVIIEKHSALKRFSNVMTLPYRGVKRLITSVSR